MKQTCILVVGMHRSGTSALTGVLNLLDVYLGSTLMEANFANEKGYFENDKLFQINEALLSQCNSSWDDTFYNEAKLEHIKEVDALKRVIKQEFESSTIFAIKDPRLALLFPIYKQVLEDLEVDIKIILPYRNPLEIARSLNKRDGMSMEKGILLWVFYFLLAEKHSREYDRVFIDFDALMQDPQKSIKKISQKLNIDLSDKYIQCRKQVEAFLEPDLKHHNIVTDNDNDNIPLIAKRILSLKEKFNNKSIVAEFDVLSEELFVYQKLFYNSDIIAVFNELKESKKYLRIQEQQYHDELQVNRQALQQQKSKEAQLQQALALKEAELQKHCKRLEEHERQLKESQAQEQQYHDELQVNKQALQQQKSKETQLQQALALKEAELQKHYKRLEEHERQLKESQAQEQQYHDELQVNKQALQQQKSKEAQLQQALVLKEAELQEHCKHLEEREMVQKKERDNLRDNLEKKNSMINHLQNELVLVYGSKSWRVTRVLRKLKRYFK